MTIKNPMPFLRQLALIDLAVETEDGGRETEGEIQTRLESARLVFLRIEPKPLWFGEYEELIEAGWGHRVAVYIAWASCPKGKRTPKTIQDVAGLLGLNSPRQVYKWRKENPVIDETVTLMQARPLFEHRADVIDALVMAAGTADYKYAPDRRTFFNLTGDLVEGLEVRVKPKLDDLSGLSDEELAILEGSLLNTKGTKGEDTKNTKEEGGEGYE